ncbi:MAG: hypothetical protein ABI563_04265 [Specibacter sp.]
MTEPLEAPNHGAEPKPGALKSTRAEKPRLTLPPPRRWAVLAAAAGAGVGSGLLGTSLHGHAWHLASGAIIPYGAALALLLMAAVSLFVGLWSKSSWVVVLCGGAAYVTAGLLSMQLGSFGMITDNLQGRVWLYGIAVTTPAVALLVWRLLLPKK